MEDVPYITRLCLNGTLSCVNLMDVIQGDIPLSCHSPGHLSNIENIVVSLRGAGTGLYHY